MKYLLVLFCTLSFVNAVEYEKSENIVIDKRNSLMWQDNKEVTQYLETLVSAKVYCENMVLNGYIDWRMPTINEMINTLDLANINAIHSKFQYVNPNIYITNTSFIADDSLLWGIDFKTGLILKESKVNTNYIRCIRDMK